MVQSDKNRRRYRAASLNHQTIQQRLNRWIQQKYIYIAMSNKNKCFSCLSVFLTQLHEPICFRNEVQATAACRPVDVGI